jgi:hypothetical protein
MLAMGPRTLAAARRLGVRKLHQASDDQIETLVDAALALLKTSAHQQPLPRQGRAGLSG